MCTSLLWGVQKTRRKHDLNVSLRRGVHVSTYLEISAYSFFEVQLFTTTSIHIQDSPLPYLPTYGFVDVAGVNAIVMVVVTVIVPGAGAVPPASPEAELEEPEVPKPEDPVVQVVVTEDTLGSWSQVWDALFELMLESISR